MSLTRRLFGSTTSVIREDLPDRHATDLAFRRALIGASLAGMTSREAVSLLQTGIVCHLTDPPLHSFDQDRVNMSDAAFQFGIPDGTSSLASFASNAPLAAAAAVSFLVLGLSMPEARQAWRALRKA